MICGREVQAQFKAVKNLRMKVQSETGQLHVSAPLNTSYATIERFVGSHTVWIDRQLEKNALHPKVARTTDAELLVEAQQLTEYWQERLEVSASRIRLRKMKTRWGVCNISTRIITINSELKKYPERCVEYVIVHELAHLRVAAHKKEFWSVVESVLPDYKLFRAMLK